MRDQDLVHRAERAATALEDAWMRWRERHGLGSGPLPPVTSYVGYSVEEPWGQPRVVFGLAAPEAERIAAILELDSYAGPAGADLRAPDRHWAESAQVPWTMPAANAGAPAQAAQPDREPLRPSQPGPLARSVPAARQADSPAAAGRPPERTAQDRPARSSAKASPAAPAPARPDRQARQDPPPRQDPPVGSSRQDNTAKPSARQDTARPRTGQARKAQPRAGQDRKAQPPGPAEFAAGPGEPLEPLPDDGTGDLTSGRPSLPDALSEAAAVVDLPADLPDNEAAYLQELAARPIARSGVAELRSHSDGQPVIAEAPAAAASPRRDTEHGVTGDDRRTVADRGVARLVQVSRRRSRKQADAAQWTEADEPKRASKGTAV